MIGYWVEVAHTPGILTSHSANADNPCEAARRVLEGHYRIEDWECVPDISSSTTSAIVMYCDPIPSGDEYRYSKQPSHKPLKVYVHGNFGANDHA